MSKGQSVINQTKIPEIYNFPRHVQGCDLNYLTIYMTKQTKLIFDYTVCTRGQSRLNFPDLQGQRTVVDRSHPTAFNWKVMFEGKEGSMYVPFNAIDLGAMHPTEFEGVRFTIGENTSPEAFEDLKHIAKQGLDSYFDQNIDAVD
ncbi:MAG TPA: hypothetical protein VHA12_02895 [Candidatus Nanoarchaeia archaeon]|nr:hypothetical protein [Candidatus Nanoarchaeia archaeon]